MREDIFPSVFQGQVNSPSIKTSIKVCLCDGSSTLQLAAQGPPREGTESREEATVANENRDSLLGPVCVQPVLWIEGKRVWEQQPAPDLQKL